MVLPRFSSRVFMVLGLMVKSLIHMEFKVSGRGPLSAFCTWLASFSSTIYYKGNPFPIACFCPVCQRSNGSRYAVLPLKPLFCSIGLYLCFGTNTMLF